MGRVKLDINKDICARLVIVMDLLNISQKEMAAILDVSQSYVSRIIRGDAEITGSMFKALFIHKSISPAFMISNELPIIYNKKNTTNLEREVLELRAEVEMMKAKLFTIISQQGQQLKDMKLKTVTKQ